MEGVVDLGGVAMVVAVSAGDAERVDGALTTTESLVQVVDRDVCEPVRRKEAARRGRAGELVADTVGLAELRLMRAASWLSEGGRRAAAGRSGFGACMEACRDCDDDDGGLDIVGNVDDELDSPCRERQGQSPQLVANTARRNLVHLYQMPPALPATSNLKIVNIKTVVVHVAQLVSTLFTDAYVDRSMVH